MLKFWKEKERYKGKTEDCLTAIITTKGCSWRNCYMCGYWSESRDLKEEVLKGQIDQVFEKIGEIRILKLFTSGSFLDEREIPVGIREYFLDRCREIGIKKLIIESRPEFIEKEKIKDFKGIELEVGIGLETANDFIRMQCINKGFDFSDFVRSAKILREEGFRIKCYLLLKPPFLSEKEAIADLIDSADKVREYVDVISLNLMNIQRDTLVERLWERGLYRPPWLWSAVEVLKSISTEIICDPVAGGKIRGPHNCGRCDKDVVSAIKLFSLKQDRSLLDLDCECKKIWFKALELEDYSRIPLFP
ncbi:MAG: archaeosine biosynthesis radical SAM protein RaSEA [Archaeoglobaceae archaeon]|nr:archaeosine biosynthesis radical SAM protein RaSEA [Archaeoglobaceae archaeon]MDW8117665.1 archaeosine biosynthesis radical SAM protein RaSEA [Archaeoglobaceae archaeon]